MVVGDSVWAIVVGTRRAKVVKVPWRAKVVGGWGGELKL